MSKLIKSGQCVEIHPRQLPPVDVDSFFIDQEPEAPEDMSTEPAETGQDEEAAAEHTEHTAADNSSLGESDDPDFEPGAEGEADQAAVESAADVEDEVLNPSDQRRQATNLLDFEDKPAPKFNPKSLKTTESTTISSKTDSEVEGVNLDQIANIATNIDSIFSGARQQAGTNTVNARQKADEITATAEHKAGSMVGQASKQAETIVSVAKDQADLVLEGARQQSQKSVEKAKHQAGVILENAHKEAADLVDQAQKQTATMLAEAKQQSAALKEQAHQDGLAEGRQEAVTVVRQELAANLTQALTLLNEIEAQRIQRLTSSEPELIKLAVAVAEKIIGEELKLDPLRQLQIVREALSRLTTANMVTVRLHSDDLAKISEHIVMLQSAFNEPKPIKIEADSSITLGSCFIETDHGNLDARIKSQLDLIMTELLKVGTIE